MQLASQSAKLTDVYDMILISNQISSQHELIQASLSKITDLLGCQIASFFGLEPDQNLHLEAWVGDGFSPGQMTDPIRSNWLPITPDVRADHSTQHAEDLPIELKQKECDSALFKWVIVQDRPLGILAVYWKAGYRFAVEEITLVSALTDGLGLIVENARLRQAEENEATTQERHRLARDLHDSVTQSLHSLVLSSQNALKENRDPERLKRILRGLDTGARQALKEMRLLLFELRLTRSEEISLVDRLKNRLDEVEHRAGIQTELHVEPGLSWPKEWDTELYPLAMEALNNSLKHARASNVSLRFSSLQDIIQMEIQDDGIGFDLESVPQGGMGLKNFAERCQHLGAHLEIISSPSNGTTIRVKIREQSQKNFQTTLKEKADE